jgi:hypothetical protein
MRCKARDRPPSLPLATPRFFARRFASSSAVWKWWRNGFLGLTATIGRRLDGHDRKVCEQPTALRESSSRSQTRVVNQLPRPRAAGRTAACSAPVPLIGSADRAADRGNHRDRSSSSGLARELDPVSNAEATLSLPLPGRPSRRVRSCRQRSAPRRVSGFACVAAANPRAPRHTRHTPR